MSVRYPTGALYADLPRTVISVAAVIQRAVQQRKRVVRLDRLAATDVIGMPPGCSVCGRAWPWAEQQGPRPWRLDWWHGVHAHYMPWICRDCQGFLCAGCVYPHTPKRCEALRVIGALSSAPSAPSAP